MEDDRRQFTYMSHNNGLEKGQQLGPDLKGRMWTVMSWEHLTDPVRTVVTVRPTATVLTERT